MSGLTAGASAAAALVVVLLGVAGRRRLCEPRRVDGTPPVAASPQLVRFALRSWRTVAVADADVASWCADLARLVRSGASLASALRTANPPAPLAAISEAIVLALDRGASIAEATRRIGAPSAGAELGLGVIRACAELGGPAAAPLERAAAMLRARAADAAERRAHSAQARLSALVLTLLPIGALALLVVSSAPTRSALAAPAGLACLAAGAVLNVAGWAWMRRLIGGAR
jgi:tight adherence protein B